MTQPLKKLVLTLSMSVRREILGGELVALRPTNSYEKGGKRGCVTSVEFSAILAMLLAAVCKRRIASCFRRVRRDMQRTGEDYSRVFQNSEPCNDRNSRPICRFSSAVSVSRQGAPLGLHVHLNVASKWRTMRLAPLPNDNCYTIAPNLPSV